jgi:hypothetical protein
MDELALFFLLSYFFLSCNFKKPIAFFFKSTGMAARILLRACVASTNPVKVGAVQLALVACFPDRAVEVEGRDVPSGVADQPMGDEETKRGAMNRLPARESTLILRGAAALACLLDSSCRGLKIASASSGNRSELKIAPRQRHFLC